ncbi:MAG: tail fiber protein [Bacteroidia bacterium]|nr:tail fiber protein [Bacteroidia bacterium]NND11674.1 phage tail protein [Flavobacteriaceae bacterium]MBT8309264.1 tail fiber protein [Bacteroidia bacterium]NNK28982.1 phage tail protein [Flavobacteriaceae bacterium]NNL61989.1 phage tail protein [Flavobacteriaceae bacterium]
MFGGNFAPQGWAECNGQLLSIAQNSALFSILGTTYGGDGETTFGLPDLRGRVPMHQGNGPGLTPRPLGLKSGSESTTLNSNNLPQHSHPAFGVSEEGSVSAPTGGYLANTKLLDGEYAATGTATQMNSGMIGVNSTSNQPVDVVQPFQTVTFIIALQGVFPSQSRTNN